MRRGRTGVFFTSENLKREESSARPQAGSELHYPSLGDSDSLVSAQIIRLCALVSLFMPAQKVCVSLEGCFYMLEKEQTRRAVCEKSLLWSLFVNKHFECGASFSCFIPHI